MGEDPAEHGRPLTAKFLKRMWAQLVLLLKNKWTLRLAIGFLRGLYWLAKKFDWL